MADPARTGAIVGPVTTGPFSALPSRGAPITAPDVVGAQVLAWLGRLVDWTGGVAHPPAMESVTMSASSVHDGTIEVDTAVTLSGARSVLVSAVLDERGEGRVRVHLREAAALVWAWHFDGYHPELGSWAHEHIADGPARRTTAQELDAALQRLLVALAGLPD